MSNFQFLLPEFKPLVEPAKGMAQRVYSELHTSCVRLHRAETFQAPVVQ